MRLFPLFVFAVLLESQTEAPLTFEVASVKRDTRHSWVRRRWTPTIDCSPIGHCGVSGNRFTEEFASLDDLMMGRNWKRKKARSTSS